uniref:Protein SZT2 n=1 Tax=Caenorhabditis japonica TaxID=281687 RepID=A0A8R1HMG4_CAEJA
MENQENETTMREAGEVFIYMHRIFRASRNLRAHWYIDHLGKSISIQQVPSSTERQEDEYSAEMTVFGIIPEGGDGTEIVGDERFLVTVRTKCTYISRYYRIVFVLDLSPSVVVADDESNCTLVDRLIPSLRNALRSSVKSFIIPGTDQIFRPQVFTSVCIFSPFMKFEETFTLCQGVFVTESNVDQVIEQVNIKFVGILERLFTFSRPILEQWGKLKRRHKNNKFDSLCESESMSDENLRKTFSADEQEVVVGSPAPDPNIDDKYVGDNEQHDGNIMSMKRGIWAATEKHEGQKQLSFASDKNLVVISDSVCGMPDESALQKVLTQLRSYTVAFSFIQLQKKACTEPVFGHVGSSQLFHFMTLATFGTYLPRQKARPPARPLRIHRTSDGQLHVSRTVEHDDIIDESADNINPFHRALICWSFQNALNDNEYLLDTFAQINHDFLELQKSHVDRHRKFLTSYEATLNRMMYVRLREGFTLKSTVFIKNNTGVILTLRLAFRPLVFIDYIITSNWPVNKNVHQTVSVELVLEGPYNELKDLLTESNYLNPTRMNLIKSVIDGIIDADSLLLHIHSFDTKLSYYLIPPGVNNEYALFQSGESASQVLPQLCIVRPDGHKVRGFVNFWKKMLDVEDNSWQKWVHTQTERGLLNLIHVPFELFTTERILKFDCRYPLNAVLYTVKVRSSFCLTENQTYVTLVYEGNDPNEKPIYFFLRKVTCNGPVVTIKTAFLGGVTSRERRIAVSCLRQRLINVTYGTILNEEDLIKEARRYTYEANAEKQYMDPKKIYEKRFEPAVTVFRRPLERMVVRYTHVPADLTTIIRSEEKTNDLEEIRLLTLHNTLAKSLSCRRSVILLNTFQPGGAHIVRLLADFCQNVIMHKRMNYENFRPGWTQNNSISLLRQVYDSSGTSLEQFIMFPATTIQPDALNNPILKRKFKKDGKVISKKNLMPSKTAVETLAMVCEQWNEPEGGNPNDQLGNMSAEQRLLEDLRFVSVLFTLDKIIRFSGQCNETAALDRMRDTNNVTGKFFPYEDRCRCTNIYELTGLPKKTPMTSEEIARLLNAKSKSKKRSEKLKTEREKQLELEHLKKGPCEVPKPPTPGIFPIRYVPKKHDGEEDLLDELDQPYPHTPADLFNYERKDLIPTVTDIHADAVTKFVTVYSNLFSLTNLVLHAQRKYLPLPHFVLGSRDEDMPRCNKLQLNALHCQLSEVSDLTWVVDKTEMDIIWADLVKTVPEEERPQQTDLRVYVKALTARMIALMFVPVIQNFDPNSQLIPFFIMTIHETQIAHCFARNAFDEHNIVNLPMSDVQERWDSAARFGWTPNNRNVFPEEATTFTSFVRHFEDELLPRIRMRAMYEAAQERMKLNEDSLLDMAGEVDCLEFELTAIPNALRNVCKHLNAPGDGPPPDEICCKGSNIAHMFRKMLAKNFIKVDGTDNIFYLNSDTMVETKSKEKKKKRRRMRTRGSSGMMYVDGEESVSSLSEVAEELSQEDDEEGTATCSDTDSDSDDSTSTSENSTPRASPADSDSSEPEVPRGRGDSLTAPEGEYYEEYTGTNQPMFIQFNCTINCNGEYTSFPINFLPTCIHSLLERLPNPPTSAEAVRRTEIVLELFVVTTQTLKPTMDVNRINTRMMRMAKSRLRNPYEFERERRDSYRRELEDLEEDEQNSEDDEKNGDSLFELPKMERRVMKDLVKNVGVILELEKILTDSRAEIVDRDLLDSVKDYIDEACTTSGKLGHAETRYKPFLLVDNSPRKFLNLMNGRESGYLKLERCEKTNMFYCRTIHDQKVFRRMKDLEARQKRVVQSEEEEEEEDEGNDGSVSDFWIIVTVDLRLTTISVHFCQRFAHQHSAMLDQLWVGIRQELRILNQESLLDRMYIQRNCDRLIVPEYKKIQQFDERENYLRPLTNFSDSTSSESPLPPGSPQRIPLANSMNSINSSLNSIRRPSPVVPKEETSLLHTDLYYYFHEGYFACPLQKELWIPIPERIRTHSILQYKNPLTLAFEKMKLAVLEYRIQNRQNTFVYRDHERNQTIYFQIHMDRDQYEFSIKGSKSKLRKKQMETIEELLETKVCLTIFAINEPHSSVVQMIWDMLVEKIDTQLLGDIMRGYLANLEQSLFASEVAFLQPSNNLPQIRFFFSIPFIFQEFLSSFLFYIGQHIEVLPNISPAKVKDNGVFYNGAAFMKTPIVDQWDSKKKLSKKSMSKSRDDNIDQGVEAKEGFIEIFPIEDKEMENETPKVRNSSQFFRSQEPIAGELPKDYSLSSFFVYHVLPASGVINTGIALLEFRIVQPDGQLVTHFDQPSMNEQSHKNLVPNVLDDKATVYRDIIKSQKFSAPKSPVEKTMCGYLEVIAWTKGVVVEETIEKMMHELIERSMFDVITEFGYLNTTIVEEGVLNGTIAFANRNSDVFLPAQDSQSSEPRMMNKQGSAVSVTASVDTRHHQHGGSMDIGLQPSNSKSTVGRMPSIVKDIEHSLAREDISLRRQDYMNRKTAYSIIKWLDFVSSKQGETNSVVKHRIRFEFQHASLPALFEIRNRLEVSLGGLHESDIRERVYLCGLRKPSENDSYTGVSLRESNLSIFGMGSHDSRFEVLTTDPFHAMTEDCGVDESQSQEEYILVSCIRNVFDGYGENMIRPKTQVEEMKQMFRNHLHGKYNPLVQTHMYSPRQRIMMAYLKGDFMTIYFYNYHKNIHTEAVDCANKIVGFHNAKSRLLREIGLHKMGITHFSPFHTDPIHEYDYEVLIWTDPTTLISKEFPGDHKPPPSYMREPQCSNIFFRMYRQPDLQETMGRSKTLFRSECVKTMHFEQMLRWRSGLKSRIDFIQKITRAHFEMTKKNTTIFEQDLLLFIRPPKNSAKKLGPPPTHTSSTSSVRHRPQHFEDDVHTEDNGSVTDRTSKRASIYGESLKSQVIAESEIFKGKGEFVKKTELKLGLAAVKFHEIRTPFFLRSDWNANIPRRTGELFDEVIRESDIRLLLEEPLKEFQEIYEVQKAKANKQLMKRKYSEKNTDVTISNVTVKYMNVAENGPESEGEDDIQNRYECDEDVWTEDDSYSEDDDDDETSEGVSNLDGESSRSNSESRGNSISHAVGDEKFERTYGKVRRAWKPNPPASPAPFDSRHNSISSTTPASRPSESGPIEKMFSFTMNAASRLSRRLTRKTSTIEKESSIDKGEEALQDLGLTPSTEIGDTEDQATMETAISPIMYKHAEEFSRYFIRKYGFLQFHVEHLNRRSKSLNRYSTSSTLFHDLPYLVFYKAYDGGVIFADLKYELPEFVVSFHIYERAKWSSADYYMVEQMAALYRKESDEIQQAANQLKDSICFMTFNFDYHLRAVATYLESLSTHKPCVFGKMNAFHVIERLLDFYQLDLILSKNLVAMKYLRMTKEHSDELLSDISNSEYGNWKGIHIKLEQDSVAVKRYAGDPIEDAICKINETHLYKTNVPVTIIELTGILGDSAKMRSRVVPCIKMRVHMDDIGDGELWPPTEDRTFIAQFEGKQRRRMIENLSKYGAENVPTPWEDSCVRQTVREMLRN